MFARHGPSSSPERNSVGFPARIVTVLVCLAVLAAGAFRGSALACSFHMYKPERTAVDWLIDGRKLALARPDPLNQFAYKIIRVIRADGDGVVGPLPFLVSSQSRRQLAANPDDAVLFATGDDGPWKMVAYVDPEFHRIMTAVLESADRWRSGYHPARFEMFAALQDHTDPAIRDLAIRELDKAPYALLRRIDLRMSEDALLADLWTPSGYPYQSIRVLLLGLTRSDKARSQIRGFIERVANWDEARNLGAFATALVEIDGRDGIVRLEDTILADRLQPLGKIEQVVEALAIHNGLGSPDTSSAISAALGRVVTLRPEPAALVARQFAARSDWSQAPSLQPLVRRNAIAALPDRLAVESYLARAKAVGVMSRPSAPRGG